MAHDGMRQHDERDLDPNQATGLIFLSIEQVAKRVCLSRRTIYTIVESGEFPQPMKLTERRIVFVQSEVVRWMEEKLAGRAA